jgi:hypothetical protein
VREQDVGPQLAQQARHDADDLSLDEQDRVVAHLGRLDVRALDDEPLQLARLGDLVAVRHLVADDLVVDARAMRQTHRGHAVAAIGVVGQRAAALVEGVGRVRADGDDAEGLGHGRTVPSARARGCRWGQRRG